MAGALHALVAAVLLPLVSLTLVDPGHQLLTTGLPPLPDLAPDQVRVTDRLLQLDRLQVKFTILQAQTQNILLEPSYTFVHEIRGEMTGLEDTYIFVHIKIIFSLLP